MNKSEALIILNDLADKYDSNDKSNFITTWYNYDERSMTYNNSINEAIDTVRKYPNLSTIALEFNDTFIGYMEDWNSEIYE